MLNIGLVEPINVLGEKFRLGQIFVPDLLIASKAMKMGVEVVKPLLLGGAVQNQGKAIFCTVEGDMHDIGKNLVALLLEAAGFEVIDLGMDVEPDAIVECVQVFADQIGSDVQHEGAREMLKKAGCNVKGKRVLFPSGLVEWATRQAPSHIHVYDREGDLAMDLGGRNVYYGTGSDCPTILDVYTGEHRTFTKKDMADGARIIDALPQLDFLMCCGLMYDYPVTSYEHQFATMVRNTTKPMMVTAANRESIANITKMAVAVKGGSLEELKKRPFFIMYNEPISPLYHCFDAVDKIICCAENNIRCCWHAICQG